MKKIMKEQEQVCQMGTNKYFYGLGYGHGYYGLDGINMSQQAYREGYISGNLDFILQQENNSKN